MSRSIGVVHKEWLAVMEPPMQIVNEPHESNSLTSQQDGTNLGLEANRRDWIDGAESIVHIDKAIDTRLTSATGWVAVGRASSGSASANTCLELVH